MQVCGFSKLICGAKRVIEEITLYFLMGGG